MALAIPGKLHAAIAAKRFAVTTEAPRSVGFAVLSGAITARTFWTAVTVFCASDSVMSSAKSDESSCQTLADPDSVADCAPSSSTMRSALP